MAMQPVTSDLQPVFEIKKSEAKRDLIIKKIAFAFIALINGGAIVGAYTFLVLYNINIPTKPFILASFAIGVVGAFVGLKGESYTAPSLGEDGRTFLGKAVTYLFFGPTEYLYRSLDWKDYSDPLLSTAIVDDLEKAPLANLKEKYESSLKNLKRYGFINEEIEIKFKELASKIKVINEEIAALKKFAPVEGSMLGGRIQAFEKEIAKVEEEWATYRKTFVLRLAKPAVVAKVESVPATPPPTHGTVGEA